MKVKKILGTVLSPFVFLISFAILTFNLSFSVFILFVLSPLKIFPRIPELMYQLAVKMNNFLFFRILRVKIEGDVDMNLNMPDLHALVVSNHQSWIDGFMIQALLSGQYPILSFLMKKELLYFPVMGLICWFYGFPALNERERKKGAAKKQQWSPQNKI